MRARPLPRHAPSVDALPAAQYIRMSTDGQDLSPQVQRQAVSEYAQRHGMRVVASYEDAGRSGLSLATRNSMRQLIRDVADEGCPFSVILVYDVSRWGRFLDTDASAYYEYHCRLHGVQVLYVNEMFSAELSPMTALLKNLKRAMAAEYSRELGVKCRAGQARAIELGYQMGLLPCLGFRRVAVSPDGHVKRQLEPGERKPSPTDRVRWIQGPDEEVELVRRIFHRYAWTRLSMRKIADELNSEGLRTSRLRKFTETGIGVLLNCRAYLGEFVWGRKDERTRSRRQDDDPAISRCSEAIPVLIDRETWERAQRKRQDPSACRGTDAELLEDLRRALRRMPNLKEHQLPMFGCPSGSSYRRRFGTFLAATDLALPNRNTTLSEARSRISCTRRLMERFLKDLSRLLRDAGVSATRPGHQCALLLAPGSRLVVQMIWLSGSGAPRWKLKKRDCGSFRHVLFVRMRDECSAHDFVVMTAHEYQVSPWSLDLVPSYGIRLHSSTELVAALQEAADCTQPSNCR